MSAKWNIRQVLDLATVSRRDDNVISMEPADPDRPPKMLTQLYRDIKSQMREAEALRLARVELARKMDEAKVAMEAALSKADREIAGAETKLKEAQERWLMITAELGISYGPVKQWEGGEGTP